jgi:cytoskeletal protein CcmA (bactofilin family)
MFTTSKRQESVIGTQTMDRATTTGTVIASGVRVEGNFTSQGDVLIEGEMNGTVVVSGMLTIGSGARVKANVTADKASVAGEVQGNVKTSGHLDLKSTARIVGDIICETVTMESGACLNGKMTMGVKGQGGAPSTVQKEAVDKTTAKP